MPRQVRAVITIPNWMQERIQQLLEKYPSKTYSGVVSQYLQDHLEALWGTPPVHKEPVPKAKEPTRKQPTPDAVVSLNPRMGGMKLAKEPVPDTNMPEELKGFLDNVLDIP
jgi:hypothetical protein